MPITDVTLLTYALGTETDVAEYLKMTAPTGDAGEMFTRIINAATDRVEKYCRRPFLVRTRDEYYRGGGERRGFLRTFPVLSITQIDELDYTGTSVMTFTSADVRVADANRGIVMRIDGGNWTAGVMNWRVQYTAGWATLADVPNDVVLAFLKMCQVYWRDYDKQRDDINSATVDGQTVFYDTDPMPKQVRGLLSPWVIPATDAMVL